MVNQKRYNQETFRLPFVKLPHIISKILHDVWPMGLTIVTSKTTGFKLQDLYEFPKLKKTDTCTQLLRPFCLLFSWSFGC